MFGLKSAYFYLVALQITFVKFLKKLYFSSNHYNNSLKSKIPVQVYFSPNPFLLSLISPFTKRSFKFDEINPNYEIKKSIPNDIELIKIATYCPTLRADNEENYLKELEYYQKLINNMKLND